MKLHMTLKQILIERLLPNEKTVVSVAKDIYGDERGGIADEISMHFDF